MNFKAFVCSGKFRWLPSSLAVGDIAPAGMTRRFRVPTGVRWTLVKGKSVLEAYSSGEWCIWAFCAAPGSSVLVLRSFSCICLC